MDPLSIFDRARSALSEIKTSEILRERLALALDQGAVLERKVSDLQAEIGELRAEVKIAHADAAKKEAELAAFREASKEEVHILEGTEFRRGARTGGRWVAFCPKCKIPAASQREDYYVACLDQKCGWVSPILHLDAVLHRLPK